MDTLSLTLRQRKLLHILQNQENLITGSELASQLNATARTIRSDVAAINLELKPFNAKIDSVRSKGYFLLPKIQIRSVNSTVSIPLSSTARTASAILLSSYALRILPSMSMTWRMKCS